MTLSVAVESPLQDDVRAMILELNDTLLALSPPEFCFHMSAEEMAEPHTTVFVARDEGRAVGCGALRRHAGSVAEVKRMYTSPDHRGRRVGGMILERIEEMARAEGFDRLVLETGNKHPAAWRVYERDYPDSPHSVFYAKALEALDPEVAT